VKEKTDIIEKNPDEQSLPVYEAEIIDEDKDIVQKQDKPPARNISYQLGRAAGVLIGLLGLFRQTRNTFGSTKGQGRGTGRGMGKGKGMGRGKRKRMRRMK
jgi:hypothetical protein